MAKDDKKATSLRPDKRDFERQEKIEELEELKKRNEELELQVKRVLADYQNLEKRVADQKRELIISANKELIVRLLPVLDTLMMVEKHTEDQGLKLSIRQFIDVLKTEGISKIETVGKDFDPKTMECVEVQKGEEGKVLTELRIGYLLNNRVLRPAQVVVGKLKINQKEEELQTGDYL